MNLARLLLVALLLAGCTLVDGDRRFEMTFPGGGNGPPALPVALEDRTGLVREIGQPALAGDFEFPDGVINMPGRLDQLAVTWESGLCTVSSSMVFAPAGAGYRLGLLMQDRPGDCLDLGIGRTLVVQLAAPIDAATIQLVMEGR